jgi:DNA-3-methyladenine glycosylase II
MEGLYNDGGGMSTEELVGRAERWRPWRTVATWYLWRSIDPEPVQY